MLTAEVWRQVCQHIDGICVGSTVAALLDRGALEMIATGTTAGRLARRLAANPGYLQVALRLLADQGWVTRAGEAGSAALTITPTPCGRAVLGELAAGYAQVPALLRTAEQADQLLAGRARLDPLHDAYHRMTAEWGLPRLVHPVQARGQVLAHLDGHVVAPVMSWLARRELLTPGAPVPLDGGPLRLAFQILAHQGWAEIEDDTAVLTPAGRVAAACAPQYWHPVSYLPTFRAVPGLLFGDPSQTWAQLTGQQEVHLDRSLDVAFSGRVFAGPCREPFLRTVRPMFDRQPVADQPAAVVDVGCGDGTLLEALYTEIKDRTVRGKAIADYPLLVVGVEPSLPARKLAAARLAGAGVQPELIDGDIAAPDTVALALWSLGVDPANALYVSKSVIHDRRYADPGDPDPGLAPPPPSAAAYTTPDGQALSPAQVAYNLVELLRSWRDLARRHGMVVIEAHTVDSAVTARLIGQTVGTDLDATHGYSCQYPVEAEVFAWAANAAGYVPVQHHEPAAEFTGYTCLTVDHFAVADPSRLSVPRPPA